MDAKLTLKLNQEIIERAKSYARTNGTSISRMVERYLTRLINQNEKLDTDDYPPVVQSLIGVIRMPEEKTDRSDYRDYLEKKYQ